MYVNRKSEPGAIANEPNRRRQALIAAARRLFVANGYAETATPDIVAAAGVTRGALYHHFDGQEGALLRSNRSEAKAVAAEIERRSIGAASPRDALLQGASAYFDAMAFEGRTKLLLARSAGNPGPPKRR